MKDLLLTQLDNIKREIKVAGIKNVPMDVRLFLLFSVLVLTIIIGVAAILFITGTFTAGLTESERLVENELDYIAAEITRQYGELSVQAISYSRELSESIEAQVRQLGIDIESLPEHPEILEKLISAEFDQALFTLQRAKSSGVFFILNATINPALANAENSKAGLYIKNMEPGIISSAAPNFIVFRGIPSISRRYALPLHAQWKMEFDVSEAPYYTLPFSAARTFQDLPLSRLYYWSPVTALPGSSEKVMLCSVPLIDSRGNIFGVCGIELNSILFKLNYTPGTHVYSRLFCILSPIDGKEISLHQSMLAGGYSAKIKSGGRDILNISKGDRSFYTYSQQDKDFLGIHKALQLYPEGSAFADDKWIAAVMIPEEDIVRSITRINLILIALLLVLVVIGIGVSLVLSRRFLRPINQGLNIIKSADLDDAPRTRMAEIDDLIKYLASHNRELYEKAREGGLSLSLLDEFLANVKELSPAERSVFNLYAKGYTANEIAETLFLSINTIKTHSKRIYMKLNVASREELLLYVNMLEEIGAPLD